MKKLLLPALLGVAGLVLAACGERVTIPRSPKITSEKGVLLAIGGQYLPPMNVGPRFGNHLRDTR
jgi:hypothetical protein